MGSLSVNLCGIGLDNPVIPASGTFGYGYEFAELYDINCLGTFSFKGTHERTPLWQSHAPHRRVHRRHDQRRGAAKSRRGQSHIRRTARS